MISICIEPSSLFQHLPDRFLRCCAAVHRLFRRLARRAATAPFQGIVKLVSLGAPHTRLLHRSMSIPALLPFLRKSLSPLLNISSPSLPIISRLSLSLSCMRIHLQTPGSRFAPRPEGAPLTPLFSTEELLNKKIWDLSPDFRHLTHLKSADRLQHHRQNAPNYAAFIPNNPFRINASEHEKLASPGCSSSH